MPDIANTTANLSLRNFQTFKQVFETTCGTFTPNIVDDQHDARKIRRMVIDSESMRQDGVLEANESYIPVRIIDSNIAKKMPTRLAYLKSSNRLAVFQPSVNLAGQPITDVSRIESEFWRVMTYEGWEVPFIRVCDGAEFTGYDFVQVSYDPSPEYEGDVCVEHVGRENLLFDLTVECIQDSKLVCRRFSTTLVSLYRLAKTFQFAQDDIIKLREFITLHNTATGVDTVLGESYKNGVFLYRAFWKEGGQVWTAWYYQDIDHWLTEPKLFYNGVNTKKEEQIPPMPGGPLEPQTTVSWPEEVETVYPFYCFLRQITEDHQIVRTQGSVDYDYPVQEAASSIFSSMTNQARLSAQVMWSPAGDNFDKTGDPKQIDIKLDINQIWDRPMQPFAPPAPNPMLSKVVQDLQQLNADQTGQIAWGVQNRQDDGRKTATEVDAAQKMQSQVNSSEVLTLSICLRPVLIAIWRIVQSQALQERIIFCPLPNGQNDTVLIEQQYTIKPAGDTDYVERQQTILNMQQDWQLIATTPAAPAFMKDYLKLRYPAKADAYIAAIDQAMGMPQKLQQVQAVAKEAVTDEDGTIKPEFQQFAPQLKQLLAPENNTPQAAQ